MSYCRFENTLIDLRDLNMDEESLSESENSAKLELIELCKNIAVEYGNIKEV